MDGHIDIKKLVVAFCKFAKAPKKYKKITVMCKIDRAHYHNTSIYLQWGRGGGKLEMDKFGKVQLT
jgi:hypothetical protein